jgi:hypothetical protein
MREITLSHPFTLLIFKRGSNKPGVLMRASWRSERLLVRSSFSLCVLKNRFYGSLSAPSAPFKRLLWALFSPAKARVHGASAISANWHQPTTNAITVCGSFYAPDSPPLSVIFIIENGLKRVGTKTHRVENKVYLFASVLSDPAAATVRWLSTQRDFNSFGEGGGGNIKNSFKLFGNLDIF